jgi:hypothetical protein
MISSMTCRQLRPGYQRINRYQIGPGNLQVDGRLLVRLFFGVKNPLRCGFVTGFQTVLFAGTRSSMKKMPLLR